MDLGLSLKLTKRGSGAYVPPNSLEWDLATASYAQELSTAAVGVQAYGYTSYYDAARDVTVLGWIANPGGMVARVAELDNSTGQIGTPVTLFPLSPLEDDSHGQITIEKLNDGRYLAFWGSHNTGYRNAVSAAADATTWTELTSLAGGTYPKLVDFPGAGGAGTCWLVHRNTGQNLEVIPITYTSLGTPTAGTAIPLVTTAGRVYSGKANKNGDFIEVAFTFSDTPDTYRRDILFARYDTVNNLLEDVTGGYSVTPSIDEATADANLKILDVGTDKNTIPQCIRDGSSNLHVVYARGSAAGTINVFHMFHNGTSWSTPADIGDTYDYDYGSGYTDGPDIDMVDGTLTACWVNGITGGWTIRGGDDLYVATYNGSTWSSSVAFSYQLGAIVGISFVKNGQSGAYIMAAERPQVGLDVDAQFFPIIVYGDTGVAWPSAGTYDKFVMLDAVFEGANGTSTLQDASNYGCMIEFAGGATIQNNALDFSGGGYVQLEQENAGAGVGRFDGNRYGYVEFALEFFDLNITGWTGIGSVVALASNKTSGTNNPFTLSWDGPNTRWVLEVGPDNATVNTYYFDDASIPDGNWDHFVLSRDSNGYVHLMRDVGSGLAEVDTPQLITPLSGPGPRVSAQKMTFGALPDGTAPMNTGSVARIRWSNRSDRGLSLAFGSAFDPVNLFGVGDLGLIIDPSQTSFYYTDTGKTTNVASDGDAIALFEDISGNTADVSQATAGDRALYKTDGTLHWMAADGTSDYYDLPTSFYDLTGDVSMATAFRLNSNGTHPRLLGADSNNGFNLNHDTATRQPRAVVRTTAGVIFNDGPAGVLGQTYVYLQHWDRSAGRLTLDSDTVEIVNATGTAADLGAASDRELFRNPDTSSNHGHIDLFFLCLIDRELTPDEEWQLVTHTAEKSGQTLP